MLYEQRTNYTVKLESLLGDTFCENICKVYVKPSSGERTYVISVRKQG